MRLVIALLLASLAVCFKRPGRANIFMIPHGEMTTNGTHRLSEDGLARAECLRELFGPGSEYHIGLIVAPQHIWRLARVEKLGYDTVAPLAKDLEVNIRASCPRKIYGCVLDAIDHWVGDGNVLICWEPKLLGKLSRLIGVRRLEVYPTFRHDIIWELTQSRNYIKERTLQKCPGLDVPWVNLDTEDDLQ
ncbi:unnamed protein product [Clonostachys solani]|uniref:Uncharacterized protein n=1 Tax=Clonostachys solani TaxID=160281 RepID=A0A9P0EKF3_9HYPO|nr:unnamed protein product [Clonostachys solani]